MKLVKLIVYLGGAKKRKKIEKLRKIVKEKQLQFMKYDEWLFLFISLSMTQRDDNNNH